jgi:hypothetical protein
MRSNAHGLAPAAALLLGSLSTNAFATDVSDELSAGALASSRHGSSPFVSDRLGGSLDATDELALSVDATFTRYFKSRAASAESILQLDGAVDYAPGDHWAFGADVRGSPPSTVTVPDATGTKYSYRSSLIGGGLSAEYDTAGDSDLETIGDTYLGLTSFRTTQRSKVPGSPKTTPPSLLQWRLSLGLTEVLWQNTEVGLTGTYYLYSDDPVDTGYNGTSVGGRGGVGDGVPLEPLRWALRPMVRERFGPVKLGAYVQYGRYVDDTGYSVMMALKVQWKVTEDVRLWGQLGFQHDRDHTGEALSIPWGSVGVRVML